MLVWRCQQFLSGFLYNDHLPLVSRQSYLSANNKGDYVNQEKIFCNLPYR